MGEIVKLLPKVGLGVMILNGENQLLLGLRNSNKEKADSELNGEGTWTMPGGKLDFGETPFQGAVREMKEETNLNLKNAEIISVTSDKGETSHFVTIGFLANDFDGEVKTMEPEEIVEWKWFDLDKLPANLFFPSKKLLMNYFEFIKSNKTIFEK
ncbi:MAG: NUDIX domain-containing protein [Rickettsiales bacterium]|jgi:ADP-ribose pyrophosphatase YjhB (NUDIX family)|nr:NUDIX domain-containing protein [Rickettsiales bacterium]